MNIFIDSADINEIKEAASLGVLDGVTTNPSLVAKTGKTLMKVIEEICEVVNGPISVEVVGLNYKDMMEEALKFAAINKNIVVKIPMTTEGLKAIKTCTEKGIKTNTTLIFSANQALLAAKAGTTFVSPFVGRLDDISHFGMELPSQIVTIFNNYGIECNVLVASVRNPIHFLEAALMGAHVATVPLSVINQLAKHPLTDLGLEKFLSDWKKVPK